MGSIAELAGDSMMVGLGLDVVWVYGECKRRAPRWPTFIVVLDRAYASPKRWDASATDNDLSPV